MYAAVYQALTAATATMKAGNTTRDLARVVREVAKRHGCKFISLFIGDGVGRGSNEKPRDAAENGPF